MSMRTVFVLGFFLVVAALLHGGVYVAGHDFVVNRFTGSYAFVPADGESEESGSAIHAPAAARCLDLSRTQG